MQNIPALIKQTRHAATADFCSLCSFRHWLEVVTGCCDDQYIIPQSETAARDVGRVQSPVVFEPALGTAEDHCRRQAETTDLFQSLKSYEVMLEMDCTKS